MNRLLPSLAISASALLLFVAGSNNPQASEPPFAPPSAPVITAGKNPIWVATHSWTAADEADYSQWVAATDIPTLIVTVGIKVDCANLAVLLRWAYAHDHGLPAANTLYATGQLFGNFSSNADWDALPTDPDWTKDQRFRAAAVYVLNGTFTHSIVGDLYPVALTREYVTPGAIILVLYSTSTGHTQVVKSVGPAPECGGGECIVVNYASEPADTIIWREPAWINQGLSPAGIMRWRWPVQVNGVWSLVDAASMPGYSTAQYAQPSMDETQYDWWTYQQIGLKITDAQMAITMAKLFHDIAQARIDHIYDVLFICHYSGANCAEGTPLYEAFSTPARDSRLRLTSAEFLAHDQAAGEETPALRAALASLARDRVLTWGGPNMRDLLFNAGGVLDRLSPDPSVSVPERWGVATTSPDYVQDQYLSLGNLLLQYFGQNRMALVEHQQASDSLDPFIKAAQTDVLGLPPTEVHMPYAMKAAFDVALQPNVQACPRNRGGLCTDYDVVFRHPDWLQHMTSAAGDSPEARFGIPTTPAPRP